MMTQTNEPAHNEPMGLLVDILRSAHNYDCTNGGVTSIAMGHTDALLVGPGIPKIFSAGKHPVLYLRTRSVGGELTFHVIPEPVGSETKWWMSGGNFIHTCDSRFREAVGNYPIPVHDRTE